MEEEIKDPYNSKARFEKWFKEKEIKGLGPANSQLVVRFITDMSLGMNVAKGSKKGARSPIRLNTQRVRICFILRELEKRRIKDIRKVTAKDLHTIFNDMRTGVLKTRNGTAYKSAGDYVKGFKSFWHWYQKISKDKIEDVCADLDARGEKPKFVYFTQEDFGRIIDKADYDLKPILALAFDSGARVTELVNIKISDFLNDYTELNIREATSKTFGRRIKLMLCSKQVKDYVKKTGLKQDDFLCRGSPSMINKDLRKIGKEVLSPEQTKFKNLTLYDFRHSSACFWLTRYKSESALKYRFGWKKSDMIHYYTEFLGMKDTINENDLYVDVTKTELEKEINSLKKGVKNQGERIRKVEKENEKLTGMNMILYNAVVERVAGKDRQAQAELKNIAKKMISEGKLVYSARKKTHPSAG